LSLKVLLNKAILSAAGYSYDFANTNAN